MAKETRNSDLVARGGDHGPFVVGDELGDGKGVFGVAQVGLVFELGVFGGGIVVDGPTFAGEVEVDGAVGGGH